MLFSVIFRYVGIALQFCILLVIARATSPDDYGKYIIVLSAAMPIYFVIGFGASESFVRESSAHVNQTGSAVRRLSGAVLLSSAMTAFIIIIIALIITMSESGPQIHYDSMLLFLALFIGNGLVFNSAQLLLGLGKSRLAGFLFYPAANISMFIALIGYVSLTHDPNFHGIALWTSAGAAATAAISLAFAIYYGRPIWPKQSDIKFLLSSGFRLAILRALYSMGLWLPTFMAGLLLSHADAAYLGTASRLAMAIAAVTAAVRFAIRPAIVRAFAAGEPKRIQQICGNAATVTFSMALIAVVGSLFLGPTLLEASFGPDFVAAAPLMSILLIGVAIEAFGGPIDEVMKMTGNDKTLLWLFSLLIPLLILGLWLTSFVNVASMAFAQVVYVSSLFGGMLYAIKKSLGIFLHPIWPNSLQSFRNRNIRS